MFKQPPRVSVHQLLWYFLTPCLSHPLLQLWNFQKPQKKPWTSNWWRYTKWNTSLISIVDLAVTKHYQWELRSVCVLSDNLDYLITWYLFNPSIRAVTKHYQWELRLVCVLCDNLDYLITWYCFNPMSAGITEFCCAGVKAQNIIHPSDGPIFTLKHAGPYLVVYK